MTSTTDLAAAAEYYAESLAVPVASHGTEEAPPAQSLAVGAAGSALLHIERACTGVGDWRRAHTWITAAVAEEIVAAPNTGLYLGVPAIGFMLDAAGTSQRYGDGLATLDRHIVTLAHRRVDLAMARIREGRLATFGEYDLLYGLTGFGALLLRRDPGGSALERILSYLIALTEPHRIDGEILPGWWVGHDPQRQRVPDYRRGHSNFGAAHGITGPLALLAQAMRHNAAVDRTEEAINTICEWLDTWRQESDTGPWWPEWISLTDLHTGLPTRLGPARPSWCYGTPGIARVGQLAGIATKDTRRQHDYEHALVQCLQDPAQQATVTDAGLCHGWAGVYQTVWRAARDADTPALAAELPRLANHLYQYAHLETTKPGLLEGPVGTALALHTAAHNTAPTSGWDRCLLID